MYSVPFCKLPVSASLGMMSGYSPAHWAASGISGKTAQLVGDFGKRGDLSSGEPELRGWKRRSVTCLQQFAKRLFPMAGWCSTGSEQSAAFHTNTEAPTRHTPTRSPCPPLPSRSRVLPPKRMPAGPQPGRTQGGQQLTPRRIPRPLCSPESDAGLAAVSPKCSLGILIHCTLSPAASPPASAEQPRSCGSAVRPAAQPGSHGSPGTRGMPAGPGGYK